MGVALPDKARYNERQHARDREGQFSMANQPTIVVEQGPDAGRKLQIPDQGARIGRSSRNDVVLADAAMSRFHCRIYPVPHKGLYVADLGSSNDTCVNDKPIQEAQLNPGDLISIGETVLRVVDTGSDTPAVAAATSAKGSEDPFIDLGLAPTPTLPRPVLGRNPRRTLWAVALGILGVFGLLALALLIWRDLPRPAPVVPPPPAPPAMALDIYYEKVEASPMNIFRYLMTLENNRLAVEIDDIQNNRQVRKSTTIDDALLRELRNFVEGSGFFNLLPEYAGIAPQTHDRQEIRVTLGPQTQRTVIFNRVAPEAFAQVRERLEIMVQNELGTAALALSPEELHGMAYQTYLLGRSLYDERALRHENLSRVIRAFREVEWYLETIEPKPDFYADAVARRQQTERELQDRFQDLEFMAERAVRNRDWREAATHLRTILDTIPDRSDDRHQRTVRRLLDIERRISRGT